MSTPPLMNTSAASQAPNSASPTAPLTQTITQTTDLAIFKGNCHCGRYRFEYSHLKSYRLVDRAFRCTCTLCSMKGYIWLPRPSTPDEGKLTWTRADGPLIKYESSLVSDEFCSNCGTGLVGMHSHGPLKGLLLVNVRAFQGVSIFFLESLVKTVDLEDEVARELLPWTPDIMYHGRCHCGTVRFELMRTRRNPEEPWPVKEDNCSSCVRDAFVGMYPMKDYVVFSDEAYTETFEYLYNQRAHGLRHCVTCGVMVFMTVYGPPDLAERLKHLEEQDPERYEAAKKIIEGKLKVQPVNLRTLERVDWYEIRQRIERTDTGTEGYVLAD
ncbi:hypothetical protein B0T13DRAFT_446581 [Neurospora crassa]|nr:hypothetical protein B0T13DRAFT_446581 [Neurospora crassa]